MSEKINFCTLDGQCGAQNLDDQRACAFYAEAQTLYPGNCVTLIHSNCVHPEALTAKLKELRNEKEPKPDEKT
ncbi:MAG: hypothetical protein ABSC54_00710 [Smithellaceae bacterium]|jgi:hypothetical protein